jgi:hypothetical protein
MSIIKNLSRSLKSGKETQPNLLIDEMTKYFVQRGLLTSYILYWIWLTVLLMALGCSSIGQEQQPVSVTRWQQGSRICFTTCAVKMHKNASKAREKIRKYLKFL